MGGEIREGGCLCGQVRYRVHGPVGNVVACHCRQCRKTSGHHVAGAPAPREAVEISGKVSWYRSSGRARRGFCANCGSSLFWDGPGPALWLFAGTLDGPTGLCIAGHIYCAEKGDYYEICDGAPQAPGDDPALTATGPADER